MESQVGDVRMSVVDEARGRIFAETIGARAGRAALGGGGCQEALTHLLV
jgi:hypothetical protein